MLEKQVKDFLTTTCIKAFSYMQPYLTNYANFSRALTQQVRVKAGGNVQYSFDLVLDELVQEQISKQAFIANVYSEESGWHKVGTPEYTIVFDPFCNSTLATKTFLDAAIGISVFDASGKFITAAILDYQTGILGLIEDERTQFYQVPSLDLLRFGESKVKTLEEAMVVFTLEKPLERSQPEQAKEIVRRVKRLMINSGHLYWLRLATGNIDCYLDPFGGEKLYEMFACTIAQKSGCIVTNRQGVPFDAAEQLQQFISDPDTIYYPVAAANSQLHAELLSALRH